MLCGYAVEKAFFFKLVLRGFMNPYHDKNLLVTRVPCSIADFHCQTTRKAQRDSVMSRFRGRNNQPLPTGGTTPKNSKPVLPT
jgi:hypothetical protein